MTTFSAEILALQARPANELTGEELWLAYGNFVKEVCLKVCAKFHFLDVRQEELWGKAYEVMIISARSYRPGKGTKFCSYLAAFLYPKMYDLVWKEQGAHYPKPAHYQTENPCAGLVFRDSAEDQSESRARGTLSGLNRKRVAQMVQNHQEQHEGNLNLYQVNPEEAVHVARLYNKVRRRLSGLAAGRGLDDQYKEDRKRHIARIRRVMLEGAQESDLAREEGVTREAMGNALRRGRYMLQDLIGLPKIPANKVRELTKNKAWTRERGLAAAEALKNRPPRRKAKKRAAWLKANGKKK